ncbi:hypothetical protein HJB80_02865 [Rhizobium lentis]|uniref:hypothetical protein n=1 Tax=Rhizobium lentis TaxID=1138194 RepID=UPI001C8390FA|nr:hypothetical protein [Rhizobium lentis]MBX5131634.1 hypothetical protein [Rhizobium lentis]
MNAQVIKREGTHTISVSAVGSVVEIYRDNHAVYIPRDAIPDLIKALQAIENERRERESL